MTLIFPFVCHQDKYCVENTGYATSESVQTQLGTRCSPALEGKSKSSLVGKKTKMGVLTGVVEIPSWTRLLQILCSFNFCSMGCFN